MLSFRINFFFPVICFVLLNCFGAHAQLPPGFSFVNVSTGWNEVEGFAWDSNGQQYVWEKGGKVWIVDTNGVKLSTPLIDISEEVGNWRDHGLNGFALDPNFLSNGYFYLFYTVDRHYLMNYGTANYNASVNEYYDATIVRVTRYQADSTTNFTTVIPGSRFILIGSTKQNGIPLLHESHSGGSLVFGTDGTLLISTGDGASAQIIDDGGSNTYWAQALLDSIIEPKENVGAFRSQMLTCLNGKILRIDPLTGDGIPSNPFYDTLDPQSAKSKVWVLGLRNPFRMTLRPGTGSTNPNDGDPGILYLGDVGWDTWEDLNVIREGGGNYGWPLFEGLTPQVSYQPMITYNEDAPNPLYGTSNCTQQFFSFQDLIKQATLDPAVTFRNPCDTSQLIPSSIPVFIHVRPDIDWYHWSPVARAGIYNGYYAEEIILNDSLSPIPGPTFNGNSSVAGCWYTGTGYPPEFQNVYFHGDYSINFIKAFYYNSGNTCDSVAHFAGLTGAVVFMAENPQDQSLYYVYYPDNINKIAYNTASNNPPVAVATADTIYGASPLTVNFTGSNSTDPENLPLIYHWDFGDTNVSSLQNPAHTFSAPAGIPTTYNVVLTVTDNGGLTAVDSLIVSINNTPPAVQIISFNDGDLYSMSHNTVLPLEALVTDAEHSPAELFYTWRVFLHHNNHEHPEAPDTNRITSCIITPIGCDSNIYYYRIELTVIDAGGLSTTVESSVWPACDPPVAAFTSTVTTICPGDQVDFMDQSTNLPDSLWWLFPGGNPPSATGANPSVVYNAAGNYDVQLIAQSIMGADTLLQVNYIFVDVCTGIEEQNLLSAPEGWEYLVYPNPAGNDLLVNDYSLKGVSEIMIKDISGRKVFQTVITHKHAAINIEFLRRGMYFIEINNACLPDRQGKIIHVQKFLKL
ncbi:MAG TPA: PKD domain-containing protein [Bacteroidia bacterium]|nr:PKD domain-containing protein [Bacteroidia bacterium]